MMKGMNIYQRETKGHPAENSSGANGDELGASHQPAVSFPQRNPQGISVGINGVFLRLGRTRMMH